MATKTDFTPEEWKQLLKAPGWASIAVVAASPSGPLGLVKELFAAGKVLAEAKSQAGQNTLVNALITDLATSEGRQQGQPSEVSGKSPEEIRKQAVVALQQVSGLLGTKGGPDADGFKRWLATLAERVAQASKEGGFLGFGGTQVSDAETTTLREIGSALGMTKV